MSQTHEINEPTMTEVLEAINTFASTIQKQFDAIQKQFEAMEKRFDERFEQIDQRFLEVDKRFDRMEAMIDRRIADLRGDLVSLMRAEDSKFVELIQELRKNGKIKPKAADRILAMQPFPHLIPLQ